MILILNLINVPRFSQSFRNILEISVVMLLTFALLAQKVQKVRLKPLLVV
nr:MAG TPA: hypothetical protein [Caudoviricetes sp.]